MSHTTQQGGSRRSMDATGVFPDTGGAIRVPPADGAHLDEHAVIYRGRLPVWQSGIPLGNGQTSVVAYQDGDALCFGVTRAGLVDGRNPMRSEGTHADVRARWEAQRYDELAAWDARENAHYMQHPYPNPRPAGVLVMAPLDEGAGDPSARHVLSLRQAELIQQTAEAATTLFVSHQYDCVCAQVQPHVPLSLDFRPRVAYPGKGEHWWDAMGDIDAEMAVTIDRTPAGFDVHVTFPGGEACCVVGLFDQGTWAPGVDHEQAWTLTPTADDQPVLLYLAVATNGETAEYVQDARARAAAARAAGFAALRQSHQADWQQFWAVNGLWLDDKFLEQLFYLEQYLLRCQLGGTGVYGSLNAWHLGTHPWHGDMHTNINVEMAWLPVFALGRAELCTAFEGHFVAQIADARQETRRFWGLPGVTFPFASVGDLRPLHGGFWRYEVYVSAWVAQVLWERYRYTGDTAYLSAVCYPVQREVLAFYAAFLERDTDGVYHLPMVKPVESQRGPEGSPFVRDMLLDVAALRQLLTAAIDASTLLNVDADLRATWQDQLAHLAPLPMDEATGLFVAYPGASPDLPNDHPVLLGPVYPSGLALSATENQAAGRALDHILRTTKRGMAGFPFTQIVAWGDDLSYAWLTIAAARLGHRELVLPYLYDLMILLQLKKNGLFASRPSNVGTRDEKVSLINTSGGFLQALTEMLLQSYDGVIRIFPATPADWTGAFAGLQAVGHVTVDAAQVDGKLRYARLTAGRDGVFTVRNDWGAVRLVMADGSVRLTDAAELRLNVTAGTAVLITPAEGSSAECSLSPGDEPRTTPRAWTGPRYLETLPPEQRWSITIGQ